MIKQDTTLALVRAAERTQAAEERREKETKAARGGWRLVAVQSIACVVILLLALFVRLGGGELYAQVRGVFGERLMQNDLAAALATLWDGDPTAAVSSDPLADDTSPSDSTTASTTTTATTTTVTTTTTTTATTTAAGVSYAGGRLPPQGAVAVKLMVNHPAYLPLAVGRLTAGYGYRENPVGEGEQFHRGIDIAAPTGTPLRAMFYGRVAAVGEDSRLGRYVRFACGGVEILYAHCDAVFAQQGMTVRAGERVATVGATGEVTGSHVHIAVSVAGVAYNPAGVVPVMCYA